jgi:hypothetical protein
MTDPTFLAELDLPASVLRMVEFSPIEDVVLAVLRDHLPDVPCVSLISGDSPPTFLMVRRVNALGVWRGDPRFVDSARFAIHAYTSDPDGDEKGAVLSEAVRVALHRAWKARKVYPNIGSINKLRVITEPTRKTDWATASGPVQFADLPTGVWRYEATYQMEIRKPRRTVYSP